MFNHGNRTLASKRRLGNTDPLQFHQTVACVLGKQPQNQAQDWRGVGKNATAMMARNPAVRWRYVRSHLSAVIVTLLQHNWVPIRHTSWKDPEGNRWSLKTGGVGIDDWGFWQAFRASIQKQLWEKAARHELGAGLDGGDRFHHAVQTRQILAKKENACSPRHATGSGNGVVLDAGATLSSRACGVVAMPEMQ